MSVRLAGLQPPVRDAADLAIAWAEYYGFKVDVTSGLRSWEDQSRLRARWESGESPFPANRPGDSAHEYGLAWDSIVLPQNQRAWDIIRRWIGFEVLENDRIHAQVPRWRDYVR